MIFSHMCQVAIKSVVFIASRSDETHTIKAITQEVQESEHTVAKILQRLSREQIIQSVKGIRGGFYITETQMTKPIQLIVDAMDGVGSIDHCVLGLNKCNSLKPCPIHEEYQHAKKIIQTILKERKINELAELVRTGTVNLIN